MSVTIYDAAAFAGMRAAGRLAAGIMDEIAGRIAPGVTTNQIDSWIHGLIVGQGARPCLLGYHGYPKTACLSVNNVVANGIANDEPLTRRDIVGVNVALALDGWHVAVNRTFALEGTPTRIRRLTEVARDCCEAAIAACRPGATTGDIGLVIATTAQAAGFAPVLDYGGHGIGRQPHEEPHIANSGRAGDGTRLEPGMLLAIMPMINAGKPDTKTRPDGWTIVTKDGKPSADWKHTVGITGDGCEVFTR